MSSCSTNFPGQRKLPESFNKSPAAYAQTWLSIKSKFRSSKQRLQEVQDHGCPPGGWQTLSQQADHLLTPTMKLATNLSLAYDELRKQSNQLMVFTGSRTDQETGLRNRRAMEEQLSILLSIHAHDSSRFALSIFSVGNSESPSPNRNSSRSPTCLTIQPAIPTSWPATAPTNSSY